MKLTIVSGTSGSGKSVALNALEDIGYHCIDNIPIRLLPDLARESLLEVDLQSVVVGIDIRNIASSLNDLAEQLDELHSLGIESQVIFLDADDTTLIKRFGETRRRHPLADNNLSLIEMIHQERKRLSPLHRIADIRIDTSRSNLYQLRDTVQSRLGDSNADGISILFNSFGYKHGLPLEADYVFDVRCLPNPHWEPKLRKLTGRDQPVCDFLESHDEVERMYMQIRDLLVDWIPRFERGKHYYLSVAIGCTGGQHRSVYISERLADYFRLKWSNVQLRHRELV